ncbi:MAG: hypothetical protein WKF96_18010 [Solirubrobacteraceae bacterium]
MPVQPRKGRQGKPTPTTVYKDIVVKIFLDGYRKGAKEVSFARSQISDAAKSLGHSVPKNLGDVVYSFRYRQGMPPQIADKAPKGKTWIIRGRGPAKYAFVAISTPYILPSPHMKTIKIPDATPGLIAQHALSTEQALLAKVRYNRLVDIFTGITCYSLQNHLRTQVSGVGQLETDEVYLGIDYSGVHYVLPVEAKGGTDKLSIVQVDQDLELCRAKFESLVARPIAAQFVGADIALFSFEPDPRTYEAVLVREARYQLVPPDAISFEDLEAYRSALAGPEQGRAGRPQTGWPGAGP